MYSSCSNHCHRKGEGIQCTVEIRPHQILASNTARIILPSCSASNPTHLSFCITVYIGELLFIKTLALPCFAVFFSLLLLCSNHQIFILISISTVAEFSNKTTQSHIYDMQLLYISIRFQKFPKGRRPFGEKAKMSKMFPTIAELTSQHSTGLSCVPILSSVSRWKCFCIEPYGMVYL